jgi:hypothetical protein
VVLLTGHEGVEGDAFFDARRIAFGNLEEEEDDDDEEGEEEEQGNSVRKRLSVRVIHLPR